MKKVVLWYLLGLLPAGLNAQTTHHGPARSRPKITVHPRLVLPVVGTTGRITYRDTVSVAGIAPERLLHANDDVFAKNFSYFDYPLSPADTIGIPRPREVAAPGEVVRIGSTTIFNPEAPPPVYVVGVSPLLAPGAKYPSYPFVSFTLRLQAEVGRCVITITDIQQRSVPFNYQMQRQMAFYEAMRKQEMPKPTPAWPARRDTIRRLVARRQTSVDFQNWAASPYRSRSAPPRPDDARHSGIPAPADARPG